MIRRKRRKDDEYGGDSSVSSVKSVCVFCCMLAEVEKNDKYVGHFPELWFSGVNHSELLRGEKEQRRRERQTDKEKTQRE